MKGRAWGKFGEILVATRRRTIYPEPAEESDSFRAPRAKLALRPPKVTEIFFTKIPMTQSNLSLRRILDGELLTSFNQTARTIGNFGAYDLGYMPITRHFRTCFSHIARYPLGSPRPLAASPQRRCDCRPKRIRNPCLRHRGYQGARAA